MSESIWSSATTVGPVRESSAETSATISCGVLSSRRMPHAARSPGSSSGIDCR